MILLIGGEKGGTGKSTITINLATALAHEGQDVVIVDADPQTTSARWVARRNKNYPYLPKINCVQKTGEIFDTVKDLSSRYQQLIIDAGGRDSEELRTSMVAAKKMYIPIKASQPDIETIERVAKLVKLAKGMNQCLLAHTLISMAPTNPVIGEVEAANQFLSSHPLLKLSSAVIYERKAYRDSMLEGRGVLELNNDKAKEEILTLQKEIYS